MGVALLIRGGGVSGMGKDCNYGRIIYNIYSDISQSS